MMETAHNRILILTGPAGAGKNTIVDLFAKQRTKCAVIDVDVVRWMVAQPHKAPWDGEEGLVQQKLCVENACMLAKNFIQNGYDVVILDVISDREMLKTYGAEALKTMSRDERFEKYFALREKYDKELEEKGLDRIVIE